MEKTLGSYWHPIARSEEVSNKPARFMLLGEKLVAFRSKEGVAVFKDLCIHRGAALSGGTVDESGNIVCPYHGWAYNRSGACVQIPSLAPDAPIPAKARAIAVHAREAYGMIWACMAAEEAPFPTWPDDAFERDDYKVCYVKAYDWKASAGRVVENAMDFSHFNFVHVGYTELADGPIIKPYEVNGTETGFQYAYDDGHLLRNYAVDFPFIVHDRKTVVSAEGGSTWSDSPDSKEGDVTILSFICSPIDDRHTRIYVYVSRNHSLHRDDAEFTGGFDTVMGQDQVIVEEQRPEQIPLDVKEELHLRFPDAAAIVYRRKLRTLAGVDAYIPD